MTTDKTQPEPVRDPAGDHLLTPQNCVVAFIDYQPEQYSTITSATRDEIDLGAVALAKLATSYEVPVVLSTVGVQMGVNQGTAEHLREALPGVSEIDRSGVNAWEDEEFREAILATGRRKVVIAGLWTEVCLAFPTLDMLAEGFDVYPVVDAIGGISPLSHEQALRRITAAGAQPVNAMSFGAELMRNWARSDADNLRHVMNWYFPKRRDLGLDRHQ
ncbi:isochorismatase family protein [Cellulosimicrobium funkei]|nr:isochorismatase family protein [Cellulosimicrobium funkei]